ncbi:MAG: hypothetical protein ABI542_08525 [Gemmatimonadota bacterium]
MPPTPTKPPKRLADGHVGEKMENLRILITLAPWLYIVLVIIEGLVGLSAGQWWLALFVINPLLVYLVSRVLRGAFGGIASTFMGGLLSTRGTAHTREFSEMESLIVRGEFAEAADRYRSHLVAFPDDTDASIRLAVLTAEKLRDPDAAVAHYLHARESGPTPQQETLIGNGLIDLYRAAGDAHALRAELARFARLHQHSAAGRHALEALKGMPS